MHVVHALAAPPRAALAHAWRGADRGSATSARIFGGFEFGRSFSGAQWRRGLYGCQRITYCYRPSKVRFLSFLLCPPPPQVVSSFPCEHYKNKKSELCPKCFGCRLDISGNTMGDDGVFALTTPLQHLLMLTTLDVHDNAISSKGLAVLSPCIALLPSLQVHL